jgi:hypothetical protein
MILDMFDGTHIHRLRYASRDYIWKSVRDNWTGIIEFLGSEDIGTS